MNIFTYVKEVAPKLKLSKRTRSQYGILAFDIEDLGSVDPSSLPAQLSDDLDDAFPKGPWFVQVRSWSPVAQLAVKNGHYKLDKNGALAVASYGQSETICSERWLLGGFTGYLESYYAATGRAPKSVSLYTTMTPCRKCNAYMKSFPGGRYTIPGAGEAINIGMWTLGYRKNYDLDYATVSDGDAATKELEKSSWQVLKDAG